MKLNIEGDLVIVRLSRRNLKALLDKLDIQGSACTLTKDELVVIAEDDEHHYGSRGYGPGPTLTKEGILW